MSFTREFSTSTSRTHATHHLWSYIQVTYPDSCTGVISLSSGDTLSSLNSFEEEKTRVLTVSWESGMKEWSLRVPAIVCARSNNSSKCFLSASCSSNVQYVNTVCDILSVAH